MYQIYLSIKCSIIDLSELFLGKFYLNFYSYYFYDSSIHLINNLSWCNKLFTNVILEIKF